MHLRTLLCWLALPGAALLACDQAPAASEPLIVPYSQSGVPWIFDDDGRQYLFDTGTPRSFVVPDLAGLPEDAFTTGVLADWDVRGVGEGADVVITRDLPPAILPMIGPDFGGILGADILARRPFVLDPWRGRIVFTDDEDLRPWMRESASIVEVPVEIAGGGTSCMEPGRCFEHQGLRMLVEVEIDGEPVIALVDTASTFSSMGQGLFERLPARPRPELVVTRPWDSWHFTRVAHTRIGEAELDDMPVRVKPALDTALARLSVEVNAPVELLIGHSLLLHFVAGFDYDRGILTLGRYSAPQTVETEMFERFGFWPTKTDDGCFAISAVAHDPISEAAGLDIGDCLRFADLTAEEAAEMPVAEFQRQLAVVGLDEEVEFWIRDLGGSALDDVFGPPRLVRLRKRDLLPKFP